MCQEVGCKYLFVRMHGECVGTMRERKEAGVSSVLQPEAGEPIVLLATAAARRWPGRRLCTVLYDPPGIQVD